MGRHKRKRGPQKRARGNTTRAPSKRKARTHPKKRERSTPRRQGVGVRKKKSTRTKTRLRSDPRIENAVREMNRGRSLTAAARSIGLPLKNLRTQLRGRGLLKRKGKRWIFKDDRPRKVVITTGGRSRTLTVRGYDEASIASAYQQAAKQFLRTNQLKFLEPFKGRTVQAANGRRYPLQTDPNAVHRIAAMDSPPFHEIYEITSTT
jgi:hypothetical protein